MRALRWHGRADLRLEDVDAPAVTADDHVLIDVTMAGVCGTDLHEVAHGPNMIRLAPHPLSGSEPPVTLGHEFVGRVRAIGAAVDDLAVGQRVTVDPCLRCGTCYWCLRGDYHICASGGSIGLAADGAFADAVVVPRANVIPVPDAVSDRAAAMAEPLAVGLHAITRAGVRAGDTVLVLGAGPIGLAVVLAARAAGAAHIMVSEPTARRREIALAIGATEALDPATSDVRRAAFVATGRIGPDVVVEATGRADQYELAVTAVRRGGTVALAGISDNDISVNLRQVVLFERTIRGCLGYNFEIERVLALMAQGRMDVEPLISHVVPLDEAAGVIDDMNQHRDDYLKVLISLEER